MRHIQVVGTGCAKCTKLAEAVQAIVSDLKIEATVEKVSDLNQMLELGVVGTPAVVIDGQVKTAGRVPSTQEIQGWLTESVAEAGETTKQSVVLKPSAASACCRGGSSEAETTQLEPCCGSSEVEAKESATCCEPAENETKHTELCCGSPPPEKDWSQEGDDAPWVVGEIDTPAGPVPRVSTTLGWADRLGSWKARWGMGRMRYWVKPRLYAVGTPDSESPVFVTANYKMSFDCLRGSLAGRDGWILVLDTKGINVWCAAGKGTFGTDELVHRIDATDLGDVVSHRRLIVPQMGAVGVAAHEVRQRSGFRVLFGPVRTDDLPAFVNAGMKATPEMRRVEFPLGDRLGVAVVELVMSAKYVLPVVVAFVLLGGLGTDGYDPWRMLSSGGLAAGLFLTAFLCGAILGPALLPWLPGRAFSLKGFWLGIGPGLAAGLWLLASMSPGSSSAWFGLAAWTLLLPVVTSFTMMNYTGSSTYTSLSGVRREMRRAVPLQAIGGILGVALWLVGRFV